MMTSFIIRACAKVNLTLEVLDRRPDGYHNLESVTICIGLWDRLEFEVSDGPAEIAVSVEGEGAPEGEENTVYRAAASFLAAAGRELKIKAMITKGIPAQAGLGGGSSDAAAALRALNGMTGSPLDAEDLQAMGAEIGSDVPLFMIGGTVLMRGRGEIVTPLPDVPRFWLVLAKPDYGVSTAAAYAALDKAADRTRRHRAEATSAAIRAGNLREIAECLWNDFEVPVFQMHPDIRGLKERLLEIGALGALLAGSGSAVFGIFDAPTLAESARERLQSEGGAAWLAPSLTREESLAL